MVLVSSIELGSLSHETKLSFSKILTISNVYWKRGIVSLRSKEV